MTITITMMIIFKEQLTNQSDEVDPLHDSIDFRATDEMFLAINLSEVEAYELLC